MELVKYFLSNGLKHFNYFILLPIIVVVVILDLILRRDWLCDQLQWLCKKNESLTRLKPVTGNPVKYWRNFIQLHINTNDLGGIEFHINIMTTNCKNKPTTYIGFKYLRAMRYAQKRMLRDVKRSCENISDDWKHLPIHKPEDPRITQLNEKIQHLYNCRRENKKLIEAPNVTGPVAYKLLEENDNYLNEIIEAHNEIDSLKTKMCCAGHEDYKEFPPVGKCPDCGADVDCDGDATEACAYSPVECETCGYAPCDYSC